MFHKMTIAFVLICSSTLMAQEIPQSSPAPIAHPARIVVPHDVTASSSIGHLHQAAFHLEAAGKKEQAQEIRKEIASLKREADIVTIKAQIQKLQARLNELTQAQCCIELDCKLLQVPEHVFKQYSKAEKNEHSFPGAITFEAPTNEVLAKLLKSDEVKTLSAPRLRVPSGETAKMLVGGEVALPVIQGQTPAISYRDIGFSMLACMEKLEDNQIKLNLVPQFSSLRSENGIQLTNGMSPEFNTRRVNLSIVTDEGTMIAITMGKGDFEQLWSQEAAKKTSGRTRQRDEDSAEQASAESHLLLFVTASTIQE